MFKQYGRAALSLAALVGVVAASWVGGATTGHKTVTVTKTVGAEAVYIRNLSPGFISDQQIRNSLPAWQQAINVDFAKYWHTSAYKLVFIGRKQAPHDGITAEFVDSGPQKGALAYHWTERNNAPSITVYAGTTKYYKFSTSVAFTHELEELAADPVTAYANFGYPVDYYWLQKADGSLKQEYNIGIAWFSEVSDPVEADYYTRPGADGSPVKISDFVTPAWFSDGVGSRFDFMGLCQAPLWIRPGGYGQFFTPTGWSLVENWRRNVPTDRGFFHDHEGFRN